MPQQPGPNSTLKPMVDVTDREASRNGDAHPSHIGLITVGFMVLLIATLVFCRSFLRRMQRPDPSPSQRTHTLRINKLVKASRLGRNNCLTWKLLFLVSLSTMAPRSHHQYQGPLTAHTGFWLRFVSNHVSGAFRHKLTTFDIGVAEWALMRSLLESGPIAPSQLALQLGLTRGGITKIANKLIVRSLILRTPDAQDGRAQALSLSAAGRRLIPLLAEQADTNEREWFGHLSSETIATLTGILREIAEHHELRAIPIE